MLKYLARPRNLSVGVLIGASAIAAYFVSFKSHICSTRMHTKARGMIYPNTDIKRFPVPDEFVPWHVCYSDYKPVGYTSKHILSGPVYADPDISKTVANPPLKFNELDKAYNVDRRSYTGEYEINDGFPRNPRGRTGVVGRGFLGRWGPNHAADPVVTRWKHTTEEKKFYKNDKPVLEFVAIKRKDCGQWAIPGGMVDPGDTVSNTLKKEFGEEALNSVVASEEEKKKLQAVLTKLFKSGVEIYKDYVDDPRNTDNAWMETLAMNFHDETGKAFDKFKLKAGDDAGAVAWIEVSGNVDLYANHQDMIRKVAELHHAYF
ncbi:ADP-ribose pyrophosphatase, mitochondrial-like [Actinia tenebrosa]|uniref:ADP-ribose pyrophosphatase, mitochondrial-like n=1 Tax=Actinia tenebrosa TaxID=6105 RepID=A0A6P8HC54_ACTTE|nr:ADP-ribose pyrophosphatase, mitochondrial-like [Actinia tenebrosa]